MLKIDKGLLDLGAEIAGKPVVAVKPELAGNVDQPPRPHRFDHVGVSARLGKRVGIYKAMDRHWFLPSCFHGHNAIPPYRGGRHGSLPPPLRADLLPSSS